jgi:hypothetical protein
VLVKELDLPPIRLHDLRHGAATIALASRTDLPGAAEVRRRRWLRFAISAGSAEI